jgi:hypothetical protein
VKNNPVKYTDPSGHRECESNGYYCDDKLPRFFNQVYKINQKYAGVNDLEAQVKIFKVAQSMYHTYTKSMKMTSLVFLGVKSVGPTTLAKAAVMDKVNQKAALGMGRDARDCEGKICAGMTFGDRGFHEDFQDSHSQPYHAWGYIAQAYSDNPIKSKIGYAIGLFANVVHENVQSGLGLDDAYGTSWEDFTLSIKAMNLAQKAASGQIPPEEFGDAMRVDLGESGTGSDGWLEWLTRYFGPLRGSTEE